MGFGLIGDVLEAVGGIIDSGSRKRQARAEEEFAAFNAAIAEKQAQFQLEMAEIEASLSLEEARGAANQLDANALIADENAAYEARAGILAERQAQKRWQAQVSTSRYAQAVSGFRVDDASSDVLAERVGEMELDLQALRRSNEARIDRARNEAALLRKQAHDTGTFAETQAGAIRRAGEIDAETTRLTGQASAHASRVRANGLRRDAQSVLIRSFSRLGD